MVILIAGATHTGKTALARRLIKTYNYPCLSMDHLKMGLIRSGRTSLTVFDDGQLTDYLWPIAREMVKTVIENDQDLIVEGCYIPFDWAKDFSEEYLRHIRCRWLILSREYIENHFDVIRSYANAAEKRLDDSGLDMAQLVRDNERNLAGCREHGCQYILVCKDYEAEMKWE